MSGAAAIGAALIGLIALAWVARRRERARRARLSAEQRRREEEESEDRGAW